MRGARARRTVPATLVVVILGLGCARGVAQQGIQRAIPDDALAFVGVDNVTELESGYANSPMGKLWNDPALLPLRTEIAAHIKEWSDEARATLGVDPFELPGMLQGPFAIALLAVPGVSDATAHADATAEGGDADATASADAEDTGDVGTDSEVPTPLAACLLADVGSRRDDCRALLGTLLQRLAQDVGLTVSNERIGSDDVSVLAGPCPGQVPPFELCETFHGNVFVLAVRLGGHASDDLRRLLDGLDGRARQTLASKPSFAQSLAGDPGGGNTQRVWVDVPAILDRVLARATAAGDIQPDEHKLLESLGLKDLGVFSLSAHCTNAASQLALRLDWSGNGWIPRLAQKLCQPGNFKLLRYVPADCRAVDALHADYSGLFDAVVKMLIDGKMLSAQDVVSGLAEAEEKLGFNPRDDLLDLLDGETVVVTSEVEGEDAFPGMSADPQNFTLLLGLKDGAGLRTLVDQLINDSAFRAAIRSTESHGHRIFNLPLIPSFAINYAILDDVAVISLSSHLVEDIIARHDDHDSRSLATNPAFTDMSNRLRPGYGMLSYQDAAGAMRGFFKTLAALPEKLSPARIAMSIENDIAKAEGSSAEDDESDDPDEDAAADTDTDAAADATADATAEASGSQVVVAAHAHHTHIDLGQFDWLLHLPMPDPSIVDKYFHGAAVTAMHVDEHGMQVEGVGP